MNVKPKRKEFNQISNEAKRMFFLLMLKQDKAIEDINQSQKEINKIVTEIENNISIHGINAAQYLCFYLEEINTHMKILEDSNHDYLSKLSIKIRITILMDAYCHVHFILNRINHLYGTNIYPKEFFEIKLLKNALSKFKSIQKRKPIINSLDDIRRSENQLYKRLPMEVVVNHFQTFTVRKSRNGQPFLTPEQLIAFLKRGFLNDLNQKKQKINLTSGEKGFVIKRFYELYDLTVSKYGELNKKAKYISLISENFDNWEENTISSFFRPNKTKNMW